MNEINLNNPIFVYYINVNGLSRQQAQEQVAIAKDILTYDNITTWFVPIQNGDSRIEMIYSGNFSL